jgi:hypothetical protein
MSRDAQTTRYAALTRRQAALVVAAFLALTGWFVVGARAAPPATPSVADYKQGGDVELYRAIVERVRLGQGYYDAAGAELRARGYPTRPAFNWRQPTYAWLLAAAPNPRVGSALLAFVAVAVVVLGRRWLREAGAHAALATGLMIASLAGCLVPNFIFLQESWAGLFIALSMCAFGLDRWRLGVASALAALAFRELALLPCAVGLALAVRRRRWPEVGAWVVGLAVWAALMLWHFSLVRAHLRPDDMGRSWIAFGGARFVLETARWSPFLTILPTAGAALVLPFVLLGLGGWRAPEASRVALVVFGYVGAFAIAGNPFNDYWGAVYAPLLLFGLMAAPASVRDLAAAIRSSSAPA